MKQTLFILTLFILTACSSEQKNTQEDTQIEEIMQKDSNSLQDILNEKKEGFNAKADSIKKRVYAEGIQSVLDDKIAENALQVGDNAPNFSLTNALGEKVMLNDELKNGPVILMWYRGGWCPYCNLTLRAMQDMLPQYQAGGAQLFALTPEAPDKSISTTEKNELEFQVLSDYDNKVAREYGVIFKLTDEVKEYYEKGFGLSEYNGNDKGELPLAATYVIGTNGKITYAFLDADYRNRAEPMAILEALTETK
jgi:peroxiredoxin